MANIRIDQLPAAGGAELTDLVFLGNPSTGALSKATVQQIVGGAAPINSPTLTGAPTAPTPSLSENSTRLATTAFTQALFAALIDSSPATLNTLNELAAALNDDPNFATTITDLIATKQPLNSVLTLLQGLNPQAGNVIMGQSGAWASRTSAQAKIAWGLDNVTNTTDANKPISTATQTALDLKAPLASPTFTGTVVLPTTTINGAVSAAITTVTANTTLNDTHYTVLADATGGAFTLTLPAAAGSSGRIYNIKKIDSSSNLVIVDANASETIDGALTQDISIQYVSITIQSNGTSWFILYN